MIKNSRFRKKERRLIAIEQVKNRIKRNGKAANESEQERKALTPDMESNRLEQAKNELAILEKRSG